MADEENTNEVEEEEEEGGGGSKLVLILTLVNVLVSLGIAGFIFVSFKKEQAKPSIDDVVLEEGESAEGEEGKKEGEKADTTAEGKSQLEETFGKIIQLEQFTVNLSTDGSVTPQFARVSISVEVDNEDTESEVTQKMPKIRNVIIDLFNSKLPSDLSRPSGRGELRDEIMATLNGFLKTGKIKGVYFTSFALSS